MSVPFVTAAFRVWATVEATPTGVIRAPLPPPSARSVDLHAYVTPAVAGVDGLLPTLTHVAFDLVAGSVATVTASAVNGGDPSASSFSDVIVCNITAADGTVAAYPRAVGTAAAAATAMGAVHSHPAAKGGDGGLSWLLVLPLPPTRRSVDQCDLTATPPDAQPPPVRTVESVLERYALVRDDVGVASRSTTDATAAVVPVAFCLLVSQPLFQFYTSFLLSTMAAGGSAEGGRPSEAWSSLLRIVAAGSSPVAEDTVLTSLRDRFGPSAPRGGGSNGGGTTDDAVAWLNVNCWAVTNRSPRPPAVGGRWSSASVLVPSADAFLGELCATWDYATLHTVLSILLQQGRVVVVAETLARVSRLTTALAALLLYPFRCDQTATVAVGGTAGGGFSLITALPASRVGLSVMEGILVPPLTAQNVHEGGSSLASSVIGVTEESLANVLMQSPPGLWLLSGRLPPTALSQPMPPASCIALASSATAGIRRPVTLGPLLSVKDVLLRVAPSFVTHALGGGISVRSRRLPPADQRDVILAFADYYVRHLVGEYRRGVQPPAGTPLTGGSSLPATQMYLTGPTAQSFVASASRRRLEPTAFLAKQLADCPAGPSAASELMRYLPSCPLWLEWRDRLLTVENVGGPSQLRVIRHSGGGEPPSSSGVAPPVDAMGILSLSLFVELCVRHAPGLYATDVAGARELYSVQTSALGKLGSVFSRAKDAVRNASSTTRASMATSAAAGGSTGAGATWLNGDALGGEAAATTAGGPAWFKSVTARLTAVTVNALGADRTSGDRTSGVSNSRRGDVGSSTSFDDPSGGGGAPSLGHPSTSSSSSAPLAGPFQFGDGFTAMLSPPVHRAAREQSTRCAAQGGGAACRAPLSPMGPTVPPASRLSLDVFARFAQYHQLIQPQMQQPQLAPQAPPAAAAIVTTTTTRNSDASGDGRPHRPIPAAAGEVSNGNDSAQETTSGTPTNPSQSMASREQRLRAVTDLSAFLPGSADPPAREANAFLTTSDSGVRRDTSAAVAPSVSLVAVAAAPPRDVLDELFA